MVFKRFLWVSSKKLFPFLVLLRRAESFTIKFHLITIHVLGVVFWFSRPIWVDLASATIALFTIESSLNFSLGLIPVKFNFSVSAYLFQSWTIQFEYYLHQLSHFFIIAGLRSGPFIERRRKNLIILFWRQISLIFRSSLVEVNLLRPFLPSFFDWFWPYLARNIWYMQSLHLNCQHWFSVFLSNTFFCKERS